MSEDKVLSKGWELLIAEPSASCGVVRAVSGGARMSPPHPPVGCSENCFLRFRKLSSTESSARDPVSSVLAWGGGRLNLSLLWRQNSY